MLIYKGITELVHSEANKTLVGVWVFLVITAFMGILYIWYMENKK